MRAIILLTACLAVVAAVPSNPQKIVGGSVTTIDQYPSIASLQFSLFGVIYTQACGGTILSSRAILTAADCPYGNAVIMWRVRVGSSFFNSGGVVHNIASIIIHPSYNYLTLDNDIAIMLTATVITHNNNAQPAVIAGANYNLADNQVVWAAGWGPTFAGGSPSEQLRHAQIWTVNQATCRTLYAVIGMTVTDNMLCSGSDVGGRDQCQCDSGGPLYHNSVVVGVCSWGQACARGDVPGVYARVSRYTAWIQANA